MRSYFLYGILLMYSFLIGCSDELKVDISLENHSGTIIDSIHIYTYGLDKMIRKPVPLGYDTAFEIDFSNVPKGDRELKFCFYLQDGRKIQYSDYLPNGLPPGHYDIEVLADPIRVRRGGLL